MLKVTLVNPPHTTRYPQVPMGLALLAAVLEKAGYPVKVLDANALNLVPDNVAAYVGDADVVALTAMTPTVSSAIAVARYSKQVNPRQTVILGGAHATLLPEETMQKAPEIDIVVRGEGEETFPELLSALDTGRPLDDVAGITFRSKGGLVATPPRRSEINLEALPFFAYHLLSLEQYHPHPPHGLASPSAALITSRGCPYHCAYCSKPIFGNRFRAQSPERVLAEIEYLQHRFGIREIAFYDDVFTLDKKRARAIAEGLLQRGIRLHWTCETRVNLVDKELLQLFKKAGCYFIAYGIESANPDILKTMHKDISLEQVEEAVRWTRESGIQTIGYFMLGSPGETPETIRQTIDLARKLKLDFAQFSVTTPFPGTELYRLLGERGKDIPWEAFVYAGADSQLIPLFENNRLSKEDLKFWTKRAYREFYLRPAYVWQRLTEMRSLNDLKLNLKGLKMLMGSV
ncbi:B12-binding domain-containing radical SAM protein [Chloroflexota bacterium]